MPVYQIEREMPAHELAEWFQVLQHEQRGFEPPSVDDVGLDAMASAMGVTNDGR